MSRIGKLPVVIPEKVEVKITWNTIEVKWEKWTLSFDFSNTVAVKQEESHVVVSKLHEDGKALWGTTRAVIANMVEGVSNGYKKSLEINGVWYKFEVQWQKLVLSIGFSHKVEMDVPSDLKVAMDEKAKNIIHVTWIDKQRVWQFASKIKAKKKPEPYKGKGIKYLGEYVRRKAGKTENSFILIQLSNIPMLQKQINRLRRKARVRSQISGTAKKPRLSIFRSTSHITAQLIDDEAGKTLAYVSDLKSTKWTKTQLAEKVGSEIADAAKKLKIDEIVFDRGWFAYHGRVKALADAARQW